MKLSRKFMMVGTALSLSFGTVALAGVGVASAGSPTAGTVSCSAARGSISFKPPLVSASPYKPEKATANITFSSCSGSVTSPTKGSIKARLTSVSTNQCPPPSTGDTGGTLLVKWTPSKIVPSSVSFSSKASATGGPDDGAGFVYPSPDGGTSSVSGSYEGSDSGASSSAAFYSNLSKTALLAQCATKKGLKKMTIVGGSIDLQ